jgi:hypothetical protein
MKDVKCPYCDADQEINHDDGYGYSEDGEYQQQCSECDKYFVYTTSISFYYDVRQADCLNDGEHIWEKTKTFPPECSRLKCKTCGEEKPLANPSE